MVKGSLYMMASDIQDTYHNWEYDYVGYILEEMEKQIMKARAGEMKEWKFLHYSLLMHLILFRNVAYIDNKFIDQTEDVKGPLPI
jgi:hypothetical protein